MKNVVIHKIVTFIFTEEQLKAYWEKQKPIIPFASLTNDQYMKLAEEMLHHSSHRQLEQHLIGHGWRTQEETEGLVLAEDDSREDIHIEIVDTSVPQRASNKLFIDRLTEFTCSNCHFSFYLRELTQLNQPLNCPTCGNPITVQ